jgi:hypothetical protein
MIAFQAVGLFACIPLVLWLFLGQPLGPGASLALGLAIMAGHRFVAAPWVKRRAASRCLWCGRTGAMPDGIAVSGGGATVDFGACQRAHAGSARRFFGFVHRWRVPIACGILGPLAVLLAATLARALGAGFVSHDAIALQFRAIVAFTVVTVSLAYRGADPAASPHSVFPVHNLALLGIRNTLWVFRLVGTWWLLAAAWRALTWLQA